MKCFPFSGFFAGAAHVFFQKAKGNGFIFRERRFFPLSTRRKTIPYPNEQRALCQEFFGRSLCLSKISRKDHKSKRACRFGSTIFSEHRLFIFLLLLPILCQSSTFTFRRRLFTLAAAFPFTHVPLRSLLPDPPHIGCCRDERIDLPWPKVLRGCPAPSAGPFPAPGCSRRS